MGIFEFNS